MLINHLLMLDFEPVSRHPAPVLFQVSRAPALAGGSYESETTVPYGLSGAMRVSVSDVPSGDGFHSLPGRFGLWKAMVFGLDFGFVSGAFCKIRICTWPAMGFPLGARASRHTNLSITCRWWFPPGSAGVPIGQPLLFLQKLVSPWERGRPARILVKALPRRQSAGEPTNPVKPIATTLPSLVRAGRPRSQGSQPFPAINPTYWRILQKALR